MIAIEETALLDAASHGDGQAYGALVRKYQDRLVTSMAHFIGNASEAEDIAQEAFVSAYRYLPNFRRGCTFYTWLYRIAMNCAVQWRRRG